MFKALRRTEIDLKTQFEGLEDLKVDYEEWNRILCSDIFQNNYLNSIYNNEKAKILQCFSKGDQHQSFTYYSNGTQDALKWTVSEGHSILHFASSNGMTKLVQHLLTFIQEYGIDVNARNRIRRTAFLCACVNGHTEVVKLFLAHRDVNINDADHYQMSPLIHAAKNNHWKIVGLLLQAGGIDFNAVDYLHRNAFIWACMNGNLEVMQIILPFAVDNINFDLNQEDKTGRTGFYYSSFFPSGDRQKISKMLKDNAKVLRLSTDDEDEFTLQTGDEWRQPIRIFICSSTCCQKFNPYPWSYARSLTPQDGFWNPIIGQFLCGTVCEEDDLINNRYC